MRPDDPLISQLRAWFGPMATTLVGAVVSNGENIVIKSLLLVFVVLCYLHVFRLVICTDPNLLKSKDARQQELDHELKVLRARQRPRQKKFKQEGES